MPTETLIMNESGTFNPEDQLLPIKAWAALNEVHPRTVVRWMEAGEITPPPEKGKGGQWFIRASAIRVEGAQSLATPDPFEVAVVETSTEVAEIETPDEDLAAFLADLEAQLWSEDIELYLRRLPAHIPIGLGARMLGLGIEYVKANPERYGVMVRAGRKQATVMPKRIILRELGLDRPIIVAAGRE